MSDDDSLRMVVVVMSIAVMAGVGAGVTTTGDLKVTMLVSGYDGITMVVTTVIVVTGR